MFEIISTKISDLKLIVLPSFSDERGTFIKSFHNTTFQNNGINFEIKESYFSYSEKGVIRGMHFQLPPYDHAKIVFCPQGKILDVVLDLRKKSKTFGKHLSFELNKENHTALYIPNGCAHGFQSMENDSITYYLVSSEHNPTNDFGVRYDSFGMNWPIEEPIMSARDASFVGFEGYNSPF